MESGIPDPASSSTLHFYYAFCMFFLPIPQITGAMQN